jgi:hypothetical protein
VPQRVRFVLRAQADVYGECPSCSMIGIFPTACTLVQAALELAGRLRVLSPQPCSIPRSAIQSQAVTATCALALNLSFTDDACVRLEGLLSVPDGLACQLSEALPAEHARLLMSPAPPAASKRRATQFVASFKGRCLDVVTKCVPTVGALKALEAWVEAIAFEGISPRATLAELVSSAASPLAASVAALREGSEVADAAQSLLVALVEHSGTNPFDYDVIGSIASGDTDPQTVRTLTGHCVAILQLSEALLADAMGPSTARVVSAIVESSFDVVITAILPRALASGAAMHGAALDPELLTRAQACSEHLLTVWLPSALASSSPTVAEGAVQAARAAVSALRRMAQQVNRFTLDAPRRRIAESVAILVRAVQPALASLTASIWKQSCFLTVAMLLGQDPSLGGMSSTDQDLAKLVAKSWGDDPNFSVAAPDARPRDLALELTELCQLLAREWPCEAKERGFSIGGATTVTRVLCEQLALSIKGGSMIGARGALHLAAEIAETVRTESERATVASPWLVPLAGPRVQPLSAVPLPPDAREATALLLALEDLDMGSPAVQRWLASQKDDAPSAAPPPAADAASPWQDLIHAIGPLMALPTTLVTQPLQRDCTALIAALSASMAADPLGARAVSATVQALTVPVCTSLESLVQTVKHAARAVSSLTDPETLSQGDESAPLPPLMGPPAWIRALLSACTGRLVTVLPPSADPMRHTADHVLECSRVLEPPSTHAAVALAGCDWPSQRINLVKALKEVATRAAAGTVPSEIFLDIEVRSHLHTDRPSPLASESRVVFQSASAVAAGATHDSPTVMIPQTTWSAAIDAAATAFDLGSSHVQQAFVAQSAVAKPELAPTELSCIGVAALFSAHDLKVAATALRGASTALVEILATVASPVGRLHPLSAEDVVLARHRLNSVQLHLSKLLPILDAPLAPDDASAARWTVFAMIAVLCPAALCSLAELAALTWEAEDLPRLFASRALALTSASPDEREAGGLIEQARARVQAGLAVLQSLAGATATLPRAAWERLGKCTPSKVLADWVMLLPALQRARATWNADPRVLSSYQRCLARFTDSLTECAVAEGKLDTVFLAASELALLGAPSSLHPRSVSIAGAALRSLRDSCIRLVAATDMTEAHHAVIGQLIGQTCSPLLAEELPKVFSCLREAATEPSAMRTPPRAHGVVKKDSSPRPPTVAVLDTVLDIVTVAADAHRLRHPEGGGVLSILFAAECPPANSCLVQAAEMLDRLPGEAVPNGSTLRAVEAAIARGANAQLGFALGCAQATVMEASDVRWSRNVATRGEQLLLLLIQWEGSTGWGKLQRTAMVAAATVSAATVAMQ